MNEGEPVIRLTAGDERLELTPRNSSLYMHLGNLACYNHVFVERELEKDGSILGTYIFGCTESFDDIAEYMAETGYPLHVNLNRVAQSDQEAFDKMIAQQVEGFDTIPDDWLGDE